VNKSFARDTIALPFNNIELVEDVIKKEKNNLACVIVEPIRRIWAYFTKAGFLNKLRQITRENNIVLIF